MKFRIQMIVICILFIFAAMYLGPGIIHPTSQAKEANQIIQDTFPISKDSILCLDNDTNIVHWEIWNDTLYIYTKEDSARDELERIKYIMSLEHEFDSLFEMELENNN